MKTLIGDYRSDKYNKRACIFITPTLGYEIVFYENDGETERKTCIGKYDDAENVAMNWVLNNKV